jgi:hypothetical protein
MEFFCIQIYITYLTPEQKKKQGRIMKQINFVKENVTAKLIAGQNTDGWWLWQRWSLRPRKDTKPNEAKEFRDLWSSDYMGSSEFEWGAGPKAIRNFTSSDDILILSFSTVDLGDQVKKIKQLNLLMSSIHVACRPHHKDKVVNMVASVLLGKFSDRGFKENTYLEIDDMLTAVKRSKHNPDIHAWSSIDKDLEFFMWFDNPDLIPAVMNILTYWKNKPLPT